MVTWSQCVQIIGVGLYINGITFLGNAVGVKEDISGHHLSQPMQSLLVSSLGEFFHIII